jgi:hypothetical protein
VPEAPLAVVASRRKLRRAAMFLSLFSLLASVDTILLSEGTGRIGFAVAAVFCAAMAALGARGASSTDPLLVVGADGIGHRTLA